MRTVTLGRTGLKVSKVGFGGIPIQRLSHEEAVAVVRGCLELGVTLIDTAHGYTTSEERIGDAIAGRRDSVILASKTPAQTGADAQAHLALSLKRLKVDHVDLYQLHNVATEKQWEAVTAPGGPLDVLERARQEGKIRHIGVTSHGLDVGIKAVRSGHFATMMFPFNFVASEPGLKMLDVCRQEGVTLLAMKPMAGGQLDNATLAMQYLRQFPDVIPVVGIERVEEMAEIAAIYRRSPELSAAERAEMERVAKELGTVFCRRCNYCQPCRAGIDISSVLIFPSMLKRMPPERVFGEGGFGATVERVDDCEDCGECEGRCPYHLPIRELMGEMAALYKKGRAEFLATGKG